MIRSAAHDLGGLAAGASIQPGVVPSTRRATFDKSRTIDEPGAGTLEVCTTAERANVGWRSTIDKLDTVGAASAVDAPRLGKAG